MVVDRACIEPLPRLSIRHSHFQYWQTGVSKSGLHRTSAVSFNSSFVIRHS
jgi:hypothetical protein